MGEPWIPCSEFQQSKSQALPEHYCRHWQLLSRYKPGKDSNRKRSHCHKQLDPFCSRTLLFSWIVESQLLLDPQFQCRVLSTRNFTKWQGWEGAGDYSFPRSWSHGDVDPFLWLVLKIKRGKCKKGPQLCILKQRVFAQLGQICLFCTTAQLLPAHTRVGRTLPFKDNSESNMWLRPGVSCVFARIPVVTWI